MTEPIRLPDEQPPLLSLGNVAGSPLMTAGGFLAGFAAYLITNGDQGIPTTWQGWVGLILGAAIAGGMALLRGPLKSTTFPLLVLCLSATLWTACKGDTPTTPDADSSSAAAVSSLVVGGVRIACGMMIPASDRPAVSAGLMTFSALLNTDPATAMTAVNDPAAPINENLGMALIWSTIHSWLDSLGAHGWDVYGARLMRQSVVACIQAIA